MAESLPHDLDLRIGKLSLRAGDILLARNTKVCRVEDLRRAQMALAAYVPAGCKVLVVGGDMDLSIIRLEEIEKATMSTMVPPAVEGEPS